MNHEAHSWEETWTATQHARRASDDTQAQKREARMSPYASGAIFTFADGRPIAPRPDRDDYPRDVEGDIAFMRAVAEFNDKVTNEANSAFAEGFARTMKCTRKKAK